MNCSKIGIDIENPVGISLATQTASVFPIALTILKLKLKNIKKST